MKTSLPKIALSIAALGAAVSASSQVFSGPSPYLSFADSPFSGGSFSYFHLENFEDAAFSPGWTANAGWTRVGPSSFTDSVDGDDGLINGSGTAGSSFYSGNTQSILSISFNAGVLGALPTHAGIVWTDVGSATPAIGFSPVRFEAFDSANLSLGSIGPNNLGDGVATGTTAEDRFFGLFYAGGIARIEISSAGTTDWEVDHLQYGRAAPSGDAVPEPSTTGAIAAGALLAIAALRYRRQNKR